MGAQGRHSILPVDTIPMPWDDWPKMRPSEHFARFAEELLLVTEGTLIGQPMKIHPFQRRIVAACFDGTGKRTPRQAMVSIPRGNGKTSLFAAVAVWHAVTVKGARCLWAAQSEGQALLGHEQSRAVVETSPVLAAVASFDRVSMHSSIRFENTGGVVAALPSTPSNLLGKRPSLAIVDEVSMVPNKVWSSLALGLGKHADSRIIGIGTPGYDTSGTMWRFRQLSQSEECPPGVVYHEVSASVSTREQPSSSAAIRSANPAIKAGFLDEKAIRANFDTESLSDFQRFRLGLWADRESAWIKRSEWLALDVDESAWPPEGSKVALGFDGSVGGSVKRDTTALVGAIGDRIFVVGHWAGEVVDRDEVLATIDTYLQRWTGTLTADPWFWRAELQQLTSRYGKRILESNTAAKTRFAPLVDRFSTSVRQQRLVHDGSQELQEHILAAIAISTPAGSLISKDVREQNHQGHIDLATAAVLAHAGAASQDVAPVIY